MRIYFELFAILLVSGCGQPCTPIGCALGTHLEGASCVVDSPSSPLECGEGTVSANNKCVPTEKVCGAGLVFKSGQCVVPVPLPTVSAFLASQGFEAASALQYGDYTYDTVETQFRYARSQTSAADVAGWASEGSPLIGTGMSLLIAGNVEVDQSPSSTISWAHTVTVSVSNDTAPDGSCLSGLTPSSTSGLHVSVYAWQAGAATPIVCAKAGSVRADVTRSSVTFTLNVLLGDGTVLTDQHTAHVTN